MQQTWINEIPTALSGAKARAAFSDFQIEWNNKDEYSIANRILF